ncbi:MAG: hypothetical protein DMD36_17865 [Gemmatimonadetes bacterium]|nr:MAG: hypothetical protein DMD36_17865 [Gemmatimonadota bacterium]
MKRWLPLAAAGGVVAAACHDGTTPTQPRNPAAPEFLQLQGEHPHTHIMLRKPLPGRSARLKEKGSTGISYHGGPILYSTNVAAIYWSSSWIYIGGPTPGSTGAGAQDGSLVGFFLRNLAPSGTGSPYFNINTTYFDGGGTPVQNSVTYTQFWATPTGPTAGQIVSDAQVQQEVITAFTSGALTYDASTLYAVFSGPNVNLGGGFGTQYCAYHGHFSSSYGDVKYAVMPYDWSDPAGCSAISGSGPNRDPAGDTEVNTLAHETEETATDEDLNAWYDRRGFENADKCAWTFGTTYSSNGSLANMNLGGKDFLVQRNWVNAGSGGCLLHWP